eukprot:6930901-Alexandrium_andersonii.AAC.1
MGPRLARIGAVGIGRNTRLLALRSKWARGPVSSPRGPRPPACPTGHKGFSAAPNRRKSETPPSA